MKNMKIVEPPCIDSLKQGVIYKYLCIRAKRYADCQIRMAAARNYGIRYALQFRTR